MSDPESVLRVARELEQQLRERRRALLRTLALTSEELETLERHQAGAPAEDASAESADAILSRLEGREKHELDEIEDALARLASGTFGLCEACGAAIPLSRLRAAPAARRCLNCQRKLETP